MTANVISPETGQRKNITYDLMTTYKNADTSEYKYMGFGVSTVRVPPSADKSKGHFWKLIESGKFRFVSGTFQFTFKTDVGFYKVRASTVEDGRWIWVAYDGMNGPEIASKMVSSAPTQADALEWLKEIQ